MLLPRLTVIYLFSFCCWSLQAQTDVLTLPDLRQMVGLSSPALSPDGRQAVFITSRKDFEQNRNQRELVLIDLAGKQTKVLSDRSGLGNPAWSPDGQYLSFLASGEQGRQIYLLPTDGGEARALTSAPRGVRAYSWSPDGQQIAYVTDTAPVARSGEERFNRSFEVGSNDYLLTSPPANRQVWLIRTDGTENHPLTDPELTVGTGLTLSGLSWSADAKQLTFTLYPTAFSGDSDLGRIAVLDLESGALTYPTGQQMRESAPAFVPNSGKITFQYPREGVAANLEEVYLYDPAGGGLSSRTRELDREIRNYRWLADGSLLLTGTDELVSRLWHSPAPGQFRQLPLGPVTSFSAWDLGPDNAILLVGSGNRQPAELFYKSGLQAEPVQLTHYNQYLTDRQYGKQEAFRWASTDGFQPNGVLTFPPRFDPSKQYPLVLLIHGGPTAASTLSFSPRAELLAARGWIVFQPNYRGSNNLGNSFQSAIADDAAEGPGEDVITGVRALQNEAYIDSEKIAVSGWSYGGWMTAWLIGRYPEVWAAAMAGAAPVDYTDMYSLNDLNRMRRHAITGSPYVGDNLAKAYAQSPVTHFSKLRTPTLILSNTGDYRVTITGSYKLYGALRDNNVPVQFIAYPSGGHFPGDPVQAEDVDRRWGQWLEQYLGTIRP